jgi:hypothetical protein
MADQQEGWVEWAGGTVKPPVDRNAVVEVKCRGSRLPLDPAPAFMFHWARANRCQSVDAEIIAYRIVDPTS